MKKLFLIIGLLISVYNLEAQEAKDSTYYAKIAAPGTKMIPVYNGKYKVFTQKIGSGKIKLLLLHGGPENTHEYFENFPEHLKKLGVTVYYYDQLGSYFSDTPNDPTIWNIDRFVEEVEEVRKALNLDDFYLLGHSWGGMLAELYAAKYGMHLKGLILSNVPGFFASDTKYLNSVIDSVDKSVRQRTVLLPQFKSNRPQIDSIAKNIKLRDTILNKTLAKKFNQANDSLFGRTMFYLKAGKMPEALSRSTKHIRYESIEKYNFNPFGADYKEALKKIKTPTLLIGGQNDFVHPELYPDLKKLMTNSRVQIYICPNSSHFSMWDDSEDYFRELNKFIKGVESK